MNILEEKVIPFEGLGNIKLLSSIDDIKDYLKTNNVNFKIEYQSNKGCEPEIPWTMIHIENSITLSFAKGKLWEIFLEENYSGSLPNGIKIGMKMDEALKLDSTLKYDDWNEDFHSDKGYWIEDNLENNTVLSITIFIKEVLDEDLFYKYEW